MSFRAGDHVYHRPSKETWVLAFGDGDDVSPCGWPESMARASDCELREAASDEEHVTMLRTWAEKVTGADDDVRVRRCRSQFAALGKAPTP